MHTQKQPPTTPATFQQAFELHQQGQLEQAEVLYEAFLKEYPHHVDALHFLGVLANQRGQVQRAVDLISQSLTIHADNPAAHSNLGLALHELKRFDEAIASYDRALIIVPDYAEAYYNRGNALLALKQFDDAIVSFDHALNLKPDYIDALANRGIALRELKRFEDALSNYERLLAIKPNDADAYYNYGNTLQILKRFDEAIACYDRALVIMPNNADVHCNRGDALVALNRCDEAISCFDRALHIKPDYVAALSSRGIALNNLKRIDEALANYERILAIKPDSAEAWGSCAIMQQELDRYDEALISYERALAIKPDLEFMFGSWLFLKMKLCDWRDFDNNLKTLAQGIERGEKIAVSFAVQAISPSAILQKKAAEILVDAKYPSAFLLPELVKTTHQKIRIGYFSSDYCHHPVAYLMAELFERHDRSRFEVIAFSFGAVDQKDDLRLRLEAAFDQFIDVSQQSDEQVVQLARQLEIDIAVNLNGLSGGCRTSIFAMRAAPIQVNYLGYLGTMGSDYMDYLLADETLIPVEQQIHYNEKIAYLPHSFQVNDSTLTISDKVFTRTDIGLPEQGFVFCCFNNNYKITPTVFTSWMQILQHVKGSVLWLLGDHASTEKNLRLSATAHGIDANRLIFTKRVPINDYLARHRLADLFLDTSPYNAGATASAALWAGLPVLTYLGDTFSGRMAASLLKAIGLPELITNSLEDYQALAIQLATHPEQLEVIKQTLANNRLTYPLFNTALFTQHIESAYQMMFDRYHAGLAPVHLYVPAQDVQAIQQNELLLTSPASFEQAFQLHQQGQLVQADVLYQQLLREQPQHIDALHFLGVLANQRGQAQQAVDFITQSLAIHADNPAAHSNLGLALHELKRFDEAIASYDRALIIVPDYAEAYYNRGNALLALKQFDDAIVSFDHALNLKPDYIDALANRGIALRELKRFEEALSNYERLLAIKPNDADAYYNCGNTLQTLKRFDEALINFDRALAIKPDLEFAFSNRLHIKMSICDWNNIDQHINELTKAIEQGKKVAIPFTVQAVSSSADLQKKAAYCYSEAKYPSAFLLPPLVKHSHSKIKIAYFSSDFRRHAVAYLTAKLFECHDRSRFEIIAFSFSPVSDKDNMRLKLEAIFDQFIDISQQSDEHIVRLARQLEIDIAVDLNGFTTHARVALFAMRVAPIQVSYLGYLGTMGADYMDYLLADTTLIPVEHQVYYAEKIAYLPHSFQVNDNTLPIAAKQFTRTERGLPKQGFIFCCFNDHYKITPAMFDSWMRILHQVEGSVLWLRSDNTTTETNLRLNAKTRGIASERICFASRLDMPEYLAQHHLADLFLDTSPYNAGATASAALWAGLPVLTYLGSTFSGRMAASLLHAIGLPELITNSPAEYEKLAIKLATHPKQLATLKQKLADNRLTYPLFNTALFTQHIESAYQAMFDRYQAGLAPDHIYVSASTSKSQPQSAPIIPANFTDMDKISADTLYNQGTDLLAIQQFAQAIIKYDQALAIIPNHTEAHANRGVALQWLKRLDEALVSYNNALSINPNFVDALYNRGTILRTFKRFDEAISSYEQALAINPDYEFLFGTWLYMKMAVCDWNEFDHHLNTLTTSIEQGKKASIPFFIHVISSSVALQKKVTDIFIRAKCPSNLLLPLPAKHTHQKIKIGYFSSDFRNHPVAYLTAELFERHNRSQFEVIAFSFSSTPSKDKMRLRLEAAFDQFIDVSQHSDEQVVHLTRAMEIDIAIDLNGLTEGCRVNLFAMRVAPIQVSYLGYLGTMGADYMDYLLADTTLIPTEHQAYYSEKIAYLPHSFQVNDSKLLIANKMVTRAEFNLPKQGFVFCCFNNNYKITPTVFDSWMRILSQVKGSVLWLLEDNADVANNLRLAAKSRGIDAKRLIFANRLSMADHLARHRVADLFLDTAPYNAGATASAALWAGLPVLTYLGNTFSGRMAASLLHAIGLPELITNSPAEYEKLAVKLATHPKQLAALKQKLADNRLTYPLFNTALFTQHIESAYQAMFDRYQAGLAPDHIYVQTLEQQSLPVNTVIKDQSKHTKAPSLLAKMVQKPAQLFAGIAALTKRGNNKSTTVQIANSFTQAEENIFARAQKLHQQGELAAAEILYEQLLKTQPTHQELLDSLNALKKQRRQTTPPADTSTPPSNLQSKQILEYLNKGMELHDLNRLDEALANYDHALTINPHHAEVLVNRGNVLEDLHRLDEALASYENAISVQPDYARAHSNRGNVLQSLKRYDDALNSYDRALAIRPDYPEAFYNRGNTLQACKRSREAIISYDHALAIRPDFIQALICRGNALHDCKHSADALISYNRALAISPDSAETLYNRGNVLMDLKRYDEALVDYEHALAIQPDYVEVLIGCGVVHQELKHFNDAFIYYERALAIRTDLDYMLGDALHIKMKICNWDELDYKLEELVKNIVSGKRVVTPFPVHSMSSSAAIQKQVAELYAEDKYPNVTVLPPFLTYAHQKIKIGYFSSDFGNHPVGYLTAELFECHDRSRFEIIAFSFNSDHGEQQVRLKAAFDQFIDVSQQSDEQVAQLARQLEIDIAINLNGFTTHNRTAIFAMRAAPIQVNYLGYLGTMGAEYIDYLLADSTLIPEEHQAYYTEKIAYLPNSFQVNDSKLAIADKLFTRAELGLPEQGFVFCCFNNNYKITPTVFDSWMRILQHVEGSILWLLEDNDVVAKNLQHEATVRGIDAQRIVFAKRLPMSYYLARHRVADLFLDTQPYNAGATASAALWSGLPVLTCLGTTFAGRMAASLLNAIGLPELITNNLADYEALAIQLATHPEQLAALKHTLADNRLTYPLFNTALFTQHIESIYQAMFDRYQTGLAPEHIYIPTHTSSWQEQLADAETSYKPSLKNQQHTSTDSLQPLTINSEQILTYLNQGMKLHDQHRLDEALASYDYLLAIDSNHVEALINRGNVLEDLNRLDEALASYDCAISVKPDHAKAHSNRGNVLQDLQRFDDALVSYDRALSIKSDFAEVLCNRGIVLKELKRYDEALSSYQKAINFKPDIIATHCNVINLLNQQGYIQEAKTALDNALIAIPDSLALRFIQLMMTLPIVTKTTKESAFVVRQFDKTLTDLLSWLNSSVEHQESLAKLELPPLPFLLAYRVGNHVSLLSRYGDLIAKPADKTALSIQLPRKKLRMVIVSSHFCIQSVWHIIIRGLLVNLDRTRFELILYHVGAIEDSETIFAKSLADKWRDNHTTTNLTGWLAAFANDAPDVIFYPEIGMDQMTARLAQHRLAPLQIASWGHPITTGLPTIDLYFSGELLESANADSHYRERLIRLPSTGCCTNLFNIIPEPLPELEAQLATRRGVRFIIAQTIFKFDPADDALYADIASAVGDSIFILLSDHENAWAMDVIIARLEQAFIDKGLNPKQHLLIIPWQLLPKFQSLLDLCDIYLDCPSFSGYTTAWQAVHRGLPIVTLEGEFMRQRLASGLLRKIGITDTIASSREDYVQIATKLADECRDPIRRNARRQALKTAAPKADNDISVVRAFEHAVITALAERSGDSTSS